MVDLRRFEFIAGIELKIREETSSGWHSGSVWEAGEHFLKYLQRNVSLVRSKRVLELGSGTGLVGIGCHQAGAAHVIVSDLGKAIPNLSYNVSMNLADHGTGSIEVVELDWNGDLSPVAALSPQVIIATDCVYSRETNIILSDCLERLCRRTNNTANTSPEVFICTDVRDPMVYEHFKECVQTNFKTKKSLVLDPQQNISLLKLSYSPPT